MPSLFHTFGRESGSRDFAGPNNLPTDADEWVAAMIDSIDTGHLGRAARDADAAAAAGDADVNLQNA